MTRLGANHVNRDVADHVRLIAAITATARDAGPRPRGADADLTENDDRSGEGNAEGVTLTGLLAILGRQPDDYVTLSSQAPAQAQPAKPDSRALNATLQTVFNTLALDDETRTRIAQLIGGADDEA